MVLVPDDVELPEDDEDDEESEDELAELEEDSVFAGVLPLSDDRLSVR